MNSLKKFKLADEGGKEGRGGWGGEGERKGEEKEKSNPPSSSPHRVIQRGKGGKHKKRKM